MSQSSSNNPIDIKKVAGTATAVNTGNADAGTQRVVLASNQPVIPISDNGGSLTVDGTVAISGTVPVSGTFWQATQPVSLASLPALAAGNNNIGDVDVASLPGTVAADITAIKTATELLDNAVGTDGLAVATGMIRVGGTDGTNNQTISVNTSGHVNIADGGSTISIDDGGGTITVDGTVAATQSGTWNIGSITTLPSLPAGTNAIGKLAANDGVDIGDVTINNASIAVTGTFWQATQPVSIAAAVPVTDNNGSLTVDAPVGTPVFVRLSDGTNAITALPITDNNGSITVDGTVSVNTLPAGNNNIGDVDVASLPGTVASDITAIKTATELLDNAYGVDGAAVATGMLRVGGTDGTNNQTISVNSSGHVNIADGGNSITVDGTVGISGTVPVSGTFWQATQPVSIAAAVAVTDNNGSLTVDGTVAATQSGTWTVQPGNTANTTPWLIKVSDGTNAAAIKAASTAAAATDPALVVAVSPNNSVTVVQPTAANLNATVTGTVELGATSLAALENINVTIPGTVDLGTVSLTALETINVTQSTASNFLNKPYGSVTTAAPSYTNGTDNALSLTTSGGLRTSIIDALPAGTNAIGKLAANSGVTIGAVEIAASQTLSTVTNLAQLGGNAIAMGSGVRTAGTQRVTIATDDVVPASQSGTWNVGLNAGTNAIGKLAANDGVDIGDVTINNASIAVTGTFWQATQPVSGTVTANIGTTNGLALNATLTDGTQKSVMRGGAKGTTAAADVTSTAVDANTQALDVSLKNASIAVTDNAGSLTVDAPVATPVYVRLSNGSAAVDTIPVSLASVPSHAVTNAGTFVVQENGAALTSLQLLDNAVSTDGSTAVTGMFQVGGTDGTNSQILSTNTSGHLNIADGGNSITVDGTVELGATTLAALETINAAQSGTWNVGLNAGTNAIGKLAANAGVIIGAVEIAPATTNAPSNATTTAYASSLIVKASAGTLYTITGYNSKTSAQFIQIHDSATVPADASVPKVIFLVAAQSNFAFDLTPYGRSFANGIVICNSSTGPTKTIGSADCWIDAQYK